MNIKRRTVELGCAGDDGPPRGELITSHWTRHCSATAAASRRQHDKQGQRARNQNGLDAGNEKNDDGSVLKMTKS